ncbi:amino acid adenylation domain-containing protein [Fontibacillus phaseoli]|uniref:Amino acid adenylation domain-containing protein n=1 Tax=Fontibacillus phaseoli TaxID=1416533 RepID=A0A369BA01_9BACL|nr:non-ribosomal peptide synthetase/MFS transporter [Fontibacillus phaseoli]RCX18145.1 amino acid adenylation domain-containing protein [Fontibacillus phaseoli]
MSELMDRIGMLPPEKRQQLLNKIKAKTNGQAGTRPVIEPLPRVGSRFFHEFPLSFSQERLWFMYQWEPDSPAYNIPCLFNIPVELDIPRLKQAVDRLIERHEILRTTYKASGEETVQVVQPFSPLDVPVYHLDGLGGQGEEHSTELEALVRRNSAIPFQLESELPIRAYIFTLGQREHYLLLNIHHIACDGWSLGIIMSEIQEAYVALGRSQAQAMEKPPLAVQYADYAVWQRKFMAGKEIDYHKEYWLRQFQGELPVLELPTDLPRPPVKSSRGAHIIKPLPEGFHSRLQAWCREEDVTPYMLMLAAYAVLLYGYTGQTDLIIGSPTANRSMEQIEPNIGFFVNTLPIRIKLDEASTFRETVRQVKQLALEAQEHQDFPLDKLIELLPIERDISRSPLFQVMFVLQNMHVGWEEAEEFPLRFSSSVPTSSSKFDLTFSANAYNLQVEYSVDLFLESTVQRMLDHYFYLLDSACASPHQVLADMYLLSGSERHQLLGEWAGDTATDYEEGFHVVSQIEAQAAARGDHLALVFEGVSCTYGEMNSRANRLAYYLRTQGVGPEVTVGIYMERSADFVIAMLAVLKAGGAFVPLDPSYPKDRLASMVVQSGMGMLLTQNKAAMDLQLPESGVTVFAIDDPESVRRLKSFGDDNPVLATDASNLMYMVFTSGTTGAPKGVAVELAQFHNYIRGLIGRLELTEPLSFAMASTFAADLGMSNVFGALCTGGILHVLSYELSCDPDGVASYFGNHAIDVMKVVPSHFEVLLEAANPEKVVPRKVLILAGEALSWETVRKIRALRPEVRLENHYGPTETTVSAFAYEIPDEVPEHRSTHVPIGYPFGNVRRYILDGRLRPVPVGVPGELYIGGLGVARGYYGRPELTKERFLPNPYAADEEGGTLYRTGDRVRYLRDGAVEIVGRMDRQIKIRGYRIELGEIEAVMTSFAFVSDAAVQLKETAAGEKKIVAYLVYRRDSELEQPLSELKRLLKDKLPEYMIPSHIVELDALPLNPNGKVDVRQLEAMEIPNLAVAGRGGEAPRTATEKAVYEVWRDILGLETFGIDDGFFELGGESFKALKAVRRLGDWIGIMDFFKHPTIRTLAEYIDRGKSSDRHLLHKLTRHSSGSRTNFSLVCVPYAGGSAITYQPFAAQMPEHIDLYALDLPGHDYSRKEEPLLPIREVARQCIEEIKRAVNGPVVLYGHCVGGALTMEIARQLDEEKYPLLRVFLGGTFPIARIPGRFFDWYSKLFPSDRSMSNKSYHAFLKALGGFTEVEDLEERDFMIRCLRHDARESEDYFTGAYAEKAWPKLSCPVTCIIGEKDRATELYEERYKEWEFFSDRVDLIVIPKSGHYFIKHQADEVTRWINDIVLAKNELDPYDPETDTLKGTERAERAVVKRKAAVPNLNMFFLVVFGQLLSVLGSGLTGIALGVWVFAQTGAVGDFAAISSASLIPGILVLPIAGAIVDRYDRRLVMLFSDIMMAVPIAVMAVLMATGSLEIWHIYVTSAVGSVARSFHRPAFVASIAQIIPKQYLGHANGIVQLASSSSEMIAPLVGVALYTTIGMANIFVLDFLSFIVAIATLAIVRFPNTLFRRREETFLKEVLMGWKFIIRRPGMLYMIAFFLIGNILFGLATVLIQPLVLSFGSAPDLAAVTTLGAVGAMTGGLLMSIWGGTKRMATGMVGFVILEGLSMIIAGLRPNVILTAAGVFGIWFSVTLVNTHWQSLIQTKVGLELQGRVLATNQMIAMSSMPVGYLLAGTLADSVFNTAMNPGGVLVGTLGPIIGTGPGRGIGLLIICVGVLAMAWAIVGFNFKPLRNMEDDLEDAVPDAVIEDRDTLQARLDSQVKNNQSVAAGHSLEV